MDAIMSDDTMAHLLDAFQQKYGCQASFVVRCPGRVNLIGEHIDYNGYGVLPMAIEQSIYAAVAVQPQWQTLRLNNVDAKYHEHERPVNNLEIDMSNPAWYEYFMCGYRGVVEQLQLEHVQGMCVLLSGTIPPSAGLSSSSALVCCAALSTLKAQTGKDFDMIPRDQMAELCAKSECYIGTQGGGMDQAISMMGQQGQALQIDFNPLRAHPITLPAGASFVVCHSCAELNKAATSQFNERVIECRLGTKVLAQSLGLDWRDIRTPGQLQEAMPGKRFTLKEMLIVVGQNLHDHPYTLEEICSVLEVNANELHAHCFNENTKHMREFHLQQRLMHVYAEADRVYAFADACKQGNANAQHIGELMNQSHVSCSSLYECSCPELDELVKDCRDAGALGARLTGAGWGGCVVCLVDSAQVSAFIAKLSSTFYTRTPQRAALLAGGNRLFATQPAAGAQVITL